MGSARELSFREHPRLLRKVLASHQQRLTRCSRIRKISILTISLWRGRVAPLWVAACIIAATVWDFIPFGTIMAEVEIGPALALVGLGWIGLKVLRMSDTDWERGNLPSSKELGVGAQPRVQ